MGYRKSPPEGARCAICGKPVYDDLSGCGFGPKQKNYIWAKNRGNPNTTFAHRKCFEALLPKNQMKTTDSTEVRN